MDYNLDALSDKQFERLSQVLVHKFVGPSVSVFGDGPDGGREATWRGPVGSLTSVGTWDGYGVLQAKKCEHPSQRPVENEKWFLKTAKKELDEWARQGSKRTEKPDFLLFSTNVRLSPSPDAGSDRVHAELRKHIDDLKLPIKDFRVWHYDDFQTMLDRDNGIYSSFAAWITPGDVIARLINDQFESDENFSSALRAHAAKTLIDDNYLNLTQAGNVADKPISVAEVFIDLPIEGGFWYQRRKGAAEGPLREVGVAEMLIGRADVDHQDQLGAGKSMPQNKFVVVGGPGQGKTTITQFLSQVYRAEFIQGSTSARPHDVKTASTLLHKRLEHLGIPRPSARRWPVRIVLTELADALERGECASLLGFIAHAVARRGDSDIGVEDMRRWLGLFPWIVFIDALDEVPASSNREAVLAAIRDFEIEVATAEGDVCTIATTRPQGYNDEFSPEQHKHFTLEPLSKETALQYAEGLTTVRSGEGTEAARRTLSRLRRATEDETTSRLFSSPLQVTILTVLIERVGQVPRDRWRLFSDYYRVIYQREQEKGGELSDLLREFEADVHFIHREIGHILQSRSAVAGETSSFMTKQEFDDCIRRRLTDQQHEPNEVDRLTNSFSRLVVERLVFLAVMQSEHLGFELRSIQEFMAGEFLTNQPEPTVIANLKSVAHLSHWRNTALFSFGRIFAEKDHLKAEAVQILEQLNWELEHSEVLRIGSHIALDILLDGSCHSQPKYARPLAERACALLDGPLMDREKDFSRLREGHVGTIIREKALSPAPNNLSHQLNRILVMANLAEAGDASAEESLQDLVTRGSQETKQTLIESLVRLSRLRGDSTLARMLESVVEQVRPSVLLGAEAPRDLQDVLPDEAFDGSTGWLEAAQSLGSTPFPGEEMSPVKGWGSPVHLSTRLIHAHKSSWETLSSYGDNSADWKTVRAIADFAADPTEQHLASALSLAATSSDLRILDFAPWPIAACYVSAVNRALHLEEPSALREWLKTLSKLALKGDLGGSETWETTERFFESGPTFEELLSGEPTFASDSHGEWTVPVGPAEKGAPLTILALQFYFAYPRDSDAREAVRRSLSSRLSTLRELPPGDQYLALQGLTFFTAGALVRRERHRQSGDDASLSEEVDEEQSQEILDQLRDVVRSRGIVIGQDPTFLGWLVMFRSRPGDWNMLAEATKNITNIVKEHRQESQSDTAWLGNHLYSDDRDQWLGLRILAHLDMASFLNCLPRLGRTDLDEAESSMARCRFGVFMQLARATKEEICDGRVDAQILDLCATGPDQIPVEDRRQDSVDVDLLSKLCDARRDQGLFLAARCSSILSASSPIAAYTFAKVTERLVRTSREV